MFRRFTLAALFLSLMSSLAVLAVQESANDKDRKALKGKWEVVSCLVDGQDWIQKKGPGWKLVFTFDGGRVKNEWANKDGRSDFIYAGDFKLDATKVPRWIDLPARITKAAVDATGAPGIYELKGDELKICAGGKRPTEFTSTEKNVQMLIVAKRVKE